MESTSEESAKLNPFLDEDDGSKCLEDAAIQSKNPIILQLQSAFSEMANLNQVINDLKITFFADPNFSYRQDLYVPTDLLKLWSILPDQFNNKELNLIMDNFGIIYHTIKVKNCCFST